MITRRPKIQGVETLGGQSTRQATLRKGEELGSTAPIRRDPLDPLRCSFSPTSA